jgi:hypothetical protein
MKLGILSERIQPGRPEQNGRHERMHRTLAEQTARPPEANRRRQQKAFDRFRSEYNQERPHEALGQRPPAALYTASPRVYPAPAPEPRYDSAVLCAMSFRMNSSSGKVILFFSARCWPESASVWSRLTTATGASASATFPLRGSTAWN